MRRVGEKMRSRKGASMLFALLVFMLCILAGTAELTAAAANSGRYTHMEAEQQDYLSVASAARVVRDEIVGTDFEANFTAVKRDPNPVGGGTGATTDATGSTGPRFTRSAGGGFVFESVFMDYFQHLYIEHAKTGKLNPGTGDTDIVSAFNGFFTDNYVIPASGSDEEFEYANKLTIDGIDGMSKVTLELKADKNFNITATLYTGDVDNKRNETVVELKAEVTYTDDESEVPYYYADPAGSGVYRTGVQTTVIRNIAVTWTDTNATIKDGGAVS